MTLPASYSLNFRGQLMDLSKPRIMGILNLTPDSFSDGGQFMTETAAMTQVEAMLTEGADIIDIGGASSRPGAQLLTPTEEIGRIKRVVAQVLNLFPETIISIDTFWSEVAEQMLDMGVHMINDISAGEMDPKMMTVVSRYRVPYAMMHMKGTPQTMQQLAQYDNVVEEVWQFLVGKINEAREAGIIDLVVDPGFGFGKKGPHNYQLLTQLNQFSVLDVPMLVGLSRKSLLYKLFDQKPSEVLDLNGILHFKALENGANILRVHDIAAAVRVQKLFSHIQTYGTL